MLLKAAEYRAEYLPETGIQKPLQWLMEWAGGGKTKSGVSVNEDTAISITTYWLGMLLIRETLGQFPLGIFEKTKKGGLVMRDPLKDHPAYRLVSKRPNQYMSSFTWRSVMQGHVLTYDNAYSVIERDVNAEPVSIFPIHPSRVVPKVTEDKKVVYEIDGTEIISAMNMIHIVGYTEDGLIGKSRVGIHKEALGTVKATENFAGSFYGKGVNVSGFLKTQKFYKDLEAVKTLKRSFVDTVTGQNNTMGVGMLQDGTEWVPNEVDPSKAQMNETRKTNGVTVSQILNIPLTMLKYMDAGTFNNTEQMGIEFAKYTMAPWCVNWEQELEYKLLSEREKREGNVYFKFNMNALLRGDMEAFGKFVESICKTGAYTPNRVLELLDENPFEGGDVHIIPSGYDKLENIGQENEKNTSV